MSGEFGYSDGNLAEYEIAYRPGYFTREQCCYADSESGFQLAGCWPIVKPKWFKDGSYGADGWVASLERPSPCGELFGAGGMGYLQTRRLDDKTEP